MIHRVKSQQGFTLIELLLSLTFVAFIMIFAITAVIQVMSTYNKGLAIKQINQAGRTTLEEITRYLQTTDPSAINVTALSNHRVCFGGISYVWNLYNTAPASANTYDDNSSLTLARVNDPASAMCSTAGGSYPQVPKAQSTDVLTSNVWVVNLGVTPNANSALVDVNINLAVANDPALTNGQCAVGGNVGQFCATSNFSTTVMTGGSN